MKIHPTALLILALSSLVCPQLGAADLCIVKDGSPQAEIIIAEKPPRSTRLAAAELRTYLRKISGAVLPIATKPSSNVPVQIYVGNSSHAAKLGITDKGLKHGAYRIVSGKDWMALIGDDTDFVPIEPWAKNNNDRVSGWLQRQWEKIVGESWGVPNGGMYKNRQRLPGDIGKPDGAVTKSNEKLEIWGYDERGSYNAVCGFLRGLGVRWYLPGELGEVVPKASTIPLPRYSADSKTKDTAPRRPADKSGISNSPSDKFLYDETVNPDFEIRQFSVRFGTAGDEVMKWVMRLGTRNPYGLMIAHGMHTMTHTEAIRREHPQWFALYGGRRDTQSGKRLNHLCYSNEELFQHTVRWARAQFDVYDFQSVSIMPPDAYIAICQCPLCEGKEVPEMGARGKLSNHVWDFVNRVAKEVGKTHPKKKIVCCAYGANTTPPTNIDKLEPNVQVVIVGGRRPRNSKPEQREPIRQLRQGWMAKTDNPLIVFENYPFTGRGFYLPAFVSRTIGESINATKGTSRGEDIWLNFPRYHDADGIGFDHFQVYFTARMYWGGKEQDVVAMLDEYCRLFYGPAAAQMKAFFEYCEDNWQDMENDAAKVQTALEMFAAAQGKAEPDSVFAKRLALIDDFLDALRSKAKFLAQKRGPVPKLRTVWEPKEPVVIDGKLEDQYWRECPTASTGRLSELQTGRQPIFGTTVMAGWDRGGSNLYFAIRCNERPGETLNVATKKNEDQSIWYGDVVEIELATDSHSYYQIAVNPSGALIDLDRGADKSSWYRWQSQAEVATEVSDDHWTIEIRIPVTDDENDPLNQVVGRKPSQSLPWHFNICRQRVRNNGSEYSAFAPTGSASFHVPMKFAYFYDGRSHQFDEDPTVTDYLIASRKAEHLERERKYGEALDAYLALAKLTGITEFQRSDALSRAANCARRLKDFSRADKLADDIPLKSVAKTVRMENLLAQRDWNSVVDQFGGEDLGKWPFWQIGAGAFARGRAYFAAKVGDEADADFQLALEFTSDNRTRMSILRTMGFNRERVLQNDDAALAIYRVIANSTTNTGSADYYYGLQGAARLLTKRGKYDEALKTLELVDVEKLRGSWRHSMLLARGDTLAAAGHTSEARETYRAVLNDKSAEKRQLELARQAVEALNNN